MYAKPRALPPPQKCRRCDEPTPTMADRMRHDEKHTPAFEMEDA